MSRDFVIFLVSAVVAIVVTVLVTYVFSKRAFRDQGDRDVLVAAAQIAGLASTIERTAAVVQEIAAKVNGIETAAAGTGTRTGAQTAFESIAHNAALFERLATQSAEKRGIGKYVRRIMHPGMALAVDCGTTTAWAFFECLKDGPSIGSVWTNNVFVASVMREQPDGRPVDHLFVEENPSSCILLGGRYYPSYGMTLNDVTDPVQYAIPELDRERVDLILLGTTSLEPTTGPRGRSAANRGFKRALMEKALADPATTLLVCLELDKLGLLLGEPCDAELWRQLLAVPRCTILVGGELDLASSAADTRRRITESLAAYVSAKRSGAVSASLSLVDAEGNPTAPETYLAEHGRPAY